MAEPVTTCQICARPIKSKSGLIAHHGYTRPNRGSGWQTASCFGARYRPYELACDALPLAIASLSKHIDTVTAGRARLFTAPPAGLPWTLQGYHHDTTGTALRPIGFDPHAPVLPSYTSGGQVRYARLFEQQAARMAADIKASTETLAFFRERLAAWTAPAEPVTTC